jgi:hypothetical protein
MVMNLAESTFPDHPVEVKVIKADLAGEINVLGGRATHGSKSRKGGMMALGPRGEAYKGMTGTGCWRLLMLDKATRENGGPMHATWIG